MKQSEMDTYYEEGVPTTLTIRKEKQGNLGWLICQL